MKHQKKSQKVFMSYLFVVLWLFVVTLLVVPSYQNLIIDLEDRSAKNIEYERQETRLQELQEIRSSMQNSENEIVETIALFSKEFIEYQVFEYLHDYMRSVPGNRILIRDITFSWPSESDIWFLRTQVQLSVVVANEEVLFNFMNYLTSADNEYRFFIPSFSYALWEVGGNFVAQLPLTLYHR